MLSAAQKAKAAMVRGVVGRDRGENGAARDVEIRMIPGALIAIHNQCGRSRKTRKPESKLAGENFVQLFN